MFTLYEFASSGNCYKLRLAMAQLGVKYQRVAVDITQGQSRTPEFLRINANGRVPVLETPEGEYLPESNAALWYLSSGSPLLPEAKLEQARVLQWMFFEQYSHEPFIATSRYWIKLLGAAERYSHELLEKQPKGYAALDVMESHLVNNDFFVGGRYSIADIALYAYTHVAHEGGFNLDSYAAVRAWLSRVGAQENYVTMET